MIADDSPAAPDPVHTQNHGLWSRLLTFYHGKERSSSLRPGMPEEQTSNPRRTPE